MVAGVLQREDRVDHGGDEERVGGTLPFHGGEEFRGVPAGQHDGTSAGEEDAHERHAGGVGDGSGEDLPVARPDPSGLVHHRLAQQGQPIAVRLHGCLELAGGAGGEVQDGDVVLGALHVDGLAGGGREEFLVAGAEVAGPS